MHPMCAMFLKIKWNKWYSSNLSGVSLGLWFFILGGIGVEWGIKFISCCFNSQEGWNKWIFYSLGA